MASFSENIVEQFIDPTVWVPIHTLPGFECCIEYYVNRKGDVRSTKGNQDRLLKHKKSNSNGYPMVTLTQRIGRKPPLYVCVHKLVAFAFLGLPPTPYGRTKGCSMIDHIDEDKTNCNADNLRWVSRSQNNNKHAYPRFNGRARPGLTSEQREIDTKNKNRSYMRKRREDPAFKEQEMLQQRERRSRQSTEEKVAQLERNRISDKKRRDRKRINNNKIA